MNLRKIMDQNEFNGQILCANKDGIIASEARGYKNLESKELLTLDSRMRIASVSKQITAFAMLQLCYNQKCKVEDTIDKYFPKYEHGHKITIHQLLSNCSGIAPYALDGDYSEYYMLDEFYPAFIEEVIFPKGLTFEPGTAYEYSGSGYIVLTRLIELISGLPFHEYLKENIFKPLRMNNTGFDFGNPNDDTVTPYDFKDGQVIPAASIDMRLAGGGGGLFSCVNDLYKWNMSLLNHTLLPKEWICKMFTKYIPINSAVSYGYGMFLAVDTEVDPPIDIYYHTGGGPGVQAIDSYFPHNTTQVIMITNINDKETFHTTRAELYKLFYKGV